MMIDDAKENILGHESNLHEVLRHYSGNTLPDLVPYPNPPCVKFRHEIFANRPIVYPILGIPLDSIGDSSILVVLD